MFDALEPWGVGIDLAAAAVLADALGSGFLSLTETAVAAIANGGDGIKASCRCKGGTGSCSWRTVDNTTRCENKGCDRCGFTLGIGIPRSFLPSLASDPEDIGNAFIESLSARERSFIDGLSRLRFPIEDRLQLLEQLPHTASRFVSRRMALPVPTLTGALDAALALSPGPVSEWAIGIYERTTISLLTQAIGGGAIALDPESRVVSVTALQTDGGLTGEVTCTCYADGQCVVSITKDEQLLFCTGSCKSCVLDVTIPTAALRFALV